MDQPKETPQSSANPAPAPQPVAPQPQTITAPEGQKVQYVVAKKSLEGLGGWLAVWLVLCGFGGIGYIGAAFSGSSGFGYGTSPLVSFVLGAAFFATAVLIAMRKKYGVWASIGSLTLSAIINIVTNLSSSDTNTSTGHTIIGYVVIVNVLTVVLLSLYFLKSERVKLTLTK